MSDERKFLHDIASPFTSIQLDLENAISLIEDGLKPEDAKECVSILKSSLQQIKRSTQLLQARRQVLIDQENK
jgi:hypothetical protein